jgi:hypothetical protein
MRCYYGPPKMGNPLPALYAQNLSAPSHHRIARPVGRSKTSEKSTFMKMALCTLCATMNIGGSGWRLDEEGNTCWELKNSSEMPESAANGCKGCQFFFALIKPRVIKREKQFAEPRSFDDYVKSAESIRIQIEEPNEYLLYFGLAYPLLYLEPCAANGTSRAQASL